MKAMLLERFGAPLVSRSVDKPRPGPGELLLRCRAAGLCGSDLKITGGKIATTPLPIIPGHEIAGDVIGRGEGVEDYPLGRRVAAHIYASCGVCSACRRGCFNMCAGLRGRLGFELNGGLAEYVVIPAANAVAIPDSVSYEDACIAPCAMLAIYHGIKRAGPIAGEKTVVLGCGGLGIHGIQFLAAEGLHAVAVDVNPAKLEKAAAMGAAECMSFDDFAAHPGPWQVILDNVGKPDVTRAALRKLDRGGRYVMVAYAPGVASEFDSEHMHLNETQILGTRNGTVGELSDIMQLLGSGAVNAVVDRVLPLEEANRALDLVRRGDSVGRVVVLPAG